MKTAIIIIIILSSSSISACNNSPTDEHIIIQLETNDFAQSETDDCCSEFCFCNCCNQISVLSLSLMQNITYKLSSTIIINSIQNLSDYSSFHWQPPKVIRI